MLLIQIFACHINSLILQVLYVQRGAPTEGANDDHQRWKEIRINCFSLSE